MEIPAAVLIAIGVAMVSGWIAFAFLLGKKRGRGDLIAPPSSLGGVAPPPRPLSPAPPGIPTGLPGEVEAEVRALLAADRKIDAIKRVREITRSSLRDAKDLVERM
jgi:hypothetical protein